MNTIEITNLADMIAANNAAPAIEIELATVKAASGGFGMFQVSESTKEVYGDLSDWANELEFDASEYAIANDADGNTYDQNGMTIFRDPNGSLHAVRFTAVEA
jgi:hypothetical protein